MFSMIYDALNRLSQVEKTGIATQSYSYDDQGRRIGKTVGPTTTNYLFNGPDIYGEYTSWSTATTTYTHGPNMDDPIIRMSGTSAQYYHQDGLGSVVGMSNNQDSTTVTQRFDAWGNSISSNGIIPQYGYTGREPDGPVLSGAEGTGLVYYRARYYDPTLGRFTQRDPIGLQGGINRYAYVRNNPANMIDYDGTLAAPWHGIITFAAAVKSGYGIGDSLNLAWKAMAADIGTQGKTPDNTVIHGMAGEFSGGVTQTPEQAITATTDYIAYNSQPDNFDNLGNALHASQDLATPAHAGELWPPDGNIFEKGLAFIKHVIGDIFPSFETIGNAFDGSVQTLNNAKTGPTNVTEPFNILTPEYGYTSETDTQSYFTTLEGVGGSGVSAGNQTVLGVSPR